VIHFRLLVNIKSKRIGSLATAIIVISLSFLPSHGGHNSALFPFSTKPVLAQPSGEDVLYQEEQLPALPSSSSSTRDLNLFMDSFANSIFNGTSTFAGVGTSIVDGVQVSGIRLDSSQNQLSITLIRTATQARGGDNITATDTTTIPSSNVPNLDSVSVIAARIPISMSDILSIAAASSSSSSLDTQVSGIGNDSTENQLNPFPSDSGFNPFLLLSRLQIGSSTLIDVDWSEPQTVTMELMGNDKTNQEQVEKQTNSTTATMADFVLVSVIPYTGMENNTISDPT
jgi:hypothetical protein